MKNTGLKVFLCIVMCIPLVAAIVLMTRISGNNVGDDGIAEGAALVIELNGKQLLKSSASDDISVYNAIIENATSVDGARSDLDEATKYAVTLSSSEGSKKYDFYMTMDPHYCVYSDEEGNYFGLDTKGAERLLARSEYVDVYAGATLPKLSFECTFPEDGSLQPRTAELTASDYDWTVKLESGEPKNCVYDVPENYTPESLIKLSKGGSYKFTFSDEPDAVTIEVEHDGKTLSSGPLADFSENVVARNDDVMYTVKITATYLDSDSRTYHGNASYIMNALYDVPTTYEPQDKGIGVGEFTIIEVANSNPGESFTVSASNMFVPEDVKMQVNGNKVFMLIPADLKCAVSPDNKLTVVSSDWGSTTFDFPIRKKNFDTKTLNGSAVASYYVESAKTQYLDAVATATASGISEKLWTDDVDFMRPCDGDSMNFGRELILTEDESIRNIGIDIFAVEGADVNSTHNGKVVFAGDLSLSGKTVIIDHGCDVFSYYMHLGGISCKVGDDVTQASTIGTVGTTGFVIEDSPYLLFAVSIGDTYTNPESVFEWGIKIPD